MLKFLRYLLSAIMIATALAGLAQAAQKAEPITLNDEQRAAIARVNDYINSFQTLRGDFVQTSDKGQSVKGVVMLSKPGKIRFDYAPPSRF